jgi:anaerobic carbon-monoxide dehydrogenase iron sulfur subunit
MEYVITIDPDRCTGCRICEMMCSLSHARECAPERSRIRNVRFEEDGRITTIPSLCMQCETAACQIACPTGATYRGGPVGAMLVEDKKCIGCSACVYACPFGASSIDPVSKKAIRCDMCEGEPRCVKNCPTEAIQFTTRSKVALQQRREKVSKLLTAQNVAAEA